LINLLGPHEDPRTIAIPHLSGPDPSVRFTASDDGRTAALYTTDDHGGDTRIIDLRDGRVISQFGTDFQIGAGRFSHDGKEIAIGTERGRLRIWDVETRLQLADVFRTRGWIHWISFLRRHSAVVALDETFEIWVFPYASDTEVKQWQN
jgi:WD40 repeat protein